jgi:hypothetical protein
MKILFFLLMYVLISFPLYAQDSTEVKNILISTPIIFQNKNKSKRIKLVAAANIIAYGGTMIALYNTWYKNYPQSRFHFFNDNKEWLQVDKAGHAWSAYSEGRASIGMWEWAGLSRKQSIWIGGLSGLAYQSIIEVLDGFSAEWGFSWGDYVGNITGCSLLIAEELGWKEQRISFKFSTHRNHYATAELNERADDIYGKNLPERILKDYNAQTYWLSANIHSFLKNSDFPKWLNIAIGYGAEGMFGAVNNKWTDKNGFLHDRSDIKRYRQIFLAPDLDFTKIKTRSKFLRTTFFILNSLKFPAPSLEFSNAKLKCNWIDF